MASQNTTLFDNQVGFSTAATPTFTEARESGGKVRCISDSYLLTSTIAAAATLTLCKLPKGARVISLELIVPASFVTSSCKIGYGTISGTTVTVVDDDRWATGLDLSAVGRKQGLVVTADADYVTTSEVAVVLTVVTGTMAALTLSWVILYVVD